MPVRESMGYGQRILTYWETSASIRARVNTARDIQNKQFARHHLQCRSARWGDPAILPVAGRRSEFDAGGYESDELVGESLSSHAKRETGAYDCRFSEV